MCHYVKHNWNQDRSVTIAHLWCTYNKLCNSFDGAFLFQCQYTYCGILKWNMASFDRKLCISQLFHTRRLNSFPIIRAAEIYLFKVLKQKRKVLKRYLQQLYAFIISLDEKKLRLCIYKRQSFLKYRKKRIKINQMEIQHETTTYYCFISRELFIWANSKIVQNTFDSWNCHLLCNKMSKMDFFYKPRLKTIWKQHHFKVNRAQMNTYTCTHILISVQMDRFAYMQNLRICKLKCALDLSQLQI